MKVDITRSSMLKSAEYNQAKQTLAIEFAKGGTYIYQEVPKAVFDGLLAAESQGSYFHKNIKDSFKVEKA